MKNTPTNEHLPLERVEIHFSSRWSKLLKVSIKPAGYWTKIWVNPENPAGVEGAAMSVPQIAKPFQIEPDRKEGQEGIEDVSEYCDPRKADGFFAWVLAVVGAAKVGMAEGSVVLGGEPANTLYSVSDSKKWAKHLLNFQKGHEPNKRAILGSFLSSGRPHSTRNVVYKLRAGFDVRMYVGGSPTEDYRAAEEALIRMYGACKAKHFRGAVVGSKPNNLPGSRCDKFIPRLDLGEALLKALASDRPVIWVYGEEGAGKAEAVRHLLADRFQSLPFEGAVWIDIRPNYLVPAIGASEIQSTLARVLDIPKLLPAESGGDLTLAGNELSRRAILLVIRHYEEVAGAEVFAWLSKMDKSKAVILSCKPPDWEEADYCREIKVVGLTREEREQFLNQSIQGAGANLPALSAQDRDVVFQVTGSNPLRHGCLIKDESSRC